MTSSIKELTSKVQTLDIEGNQRSSLTNKVSNPVSPRNLQTSHRFGEALKTVSNRTFL